MRTLEQMVDDAIADQNTPRQSVPTFDKTMWMLRQMTVTPRAVVFSPETGETR
ncbi:hypothetical protein [Aeromicrobium sp. 179-A 4D2 NHS]|uniref:hypothetical protein n=1 Tax=Aeromicrobium sp. 179-A 4D2 NHS TaxID=3142375 RepID=UPI0039A2797C